MKGAILSKLLIGGVATVFLYTDIPDTLMIRVFDKAKTIKSQYSEKFGSPLDHGTVKEEINKKLNYLYDNQEDLAKRLYNSNQEIIRYKSQLRNSIEQKAEQVKEIADRYDKAEAAKDSIEAKLKYVQKSVQKISRQQKTPQPKKQSPGFDNLFSWD